MIVFDELLSAFFPFLYSNAGSHLRFYGSTSNGRKTGKNRATVNNTNNTTNISTASTVKKPIQNASTKTAQPNLLTKQQSQQMKTQSKTIADATKTEKPIAKIPDTQNVVENSQHKPNEHGKSPEKIVNVKRVFGFFSKFWHAFAQFVDFRAFSFF